MSTLILTCLGQFQVRLDDRPIIGFESDKVRALLAYLAVEVDRAHSRSALAALLWPGYTEVSARTTLRHVLHQLRKTIGDAAASPPFLLITRQTLQFNPVASYTLDIATFHSLLDQVYAHAHPHLAGCPACLQTLGQAVALYSADFLAELTIQDSAPFEEWRRIRQEQCHLQVMDALYQLAGACAANGDYAQARDYAQRQIALEPWREEAHRQLMRALAHLGQRSAALAQYHACRQVLAAELDVEPDAATTTLYAEIRRGVRPERSERSLRQSSGQAREGQGEDGKTHPGAPALVLPAPLTPFVGREREVAMLVAHLQDPDTRLLTLVGPGGIGKTRLAIEAARCMAGAEVGDRPYAAGTYSAQTTALEPSPFPDGIFFVGLAALTHAAALAATVAAALEVPLSGGEPEQALLRFLRRRRLLLILDNFEHLLDGVALLVHILETAPGVQLLTTSHQRLNVQGEQIYLVQAMDYEPQAGLSDVAHSSAVRLFVQRAQRSQLDFHLNETNLAAVLRICQLVHGMPLGLELAAAWVEMLSLAEIAAEIEKSADFLTADWPNVPDRHRSLRAVFAWSWQLLTVAEQQVYGRLALFRGGFTRQAAEQVAGASLRVLTSLLHRSLLQRATTDETSLGRYHIHELWRQFAAEQIDGEARDAVATRHSAYYLSFVAARERRLARAEPRQAAAEIQVEIDNIRQAWTWAVQRLDMPALSQSAWALRTYYATIGSLSEGAQAFQMLVERIPASVSTGIGVAPEQPHDLCVLSKFGAIYAGLLVSQGKFAQAIAEAQRAIALAKAYGESEAIAMAYLSWGQALHQQGHYAEAQCRFEQTLQQVHHAQANAVHSELLYDVDCIAQVWLGAQATEQGLYHTAREHLQQSLSLARSLGKQRTEMICLMNLANLARYAGDFPSARQDYEQALRAWPQVGYPWGEAISYLELGDVVRLQGEYSLACDLIQNALAMFLEIGAHDSEAVAVAWLGRVYAFLGDYAQADAWLARYLHTDGEGRGEAELHHLHTRIVLALHRGEPTQALVYATQAWQIGKSYGAIVHACCLVLLGHAQTYLHHFGEASSAYSQAINLCTKLGRSDMAAEAQAGLAEIAYRQGDWPQAQRLVETILPVLAEKQQVGIDEPFYTYLSCFRVLTANHDGRAESILQTAYALLQRYAGHIADGGLRRSFWENVPVHHTLYQAYTAALNQFREDT